MVRHAFNVFSTIRHNIFYTGLGTASLSVILGASTNVQPMRRLQGHPLWAHLQTPFKISGPTCLVAEMIETVVTRYQALSNRRTVVPSLGPQPKTCPRVNHKTCFLQLKLSHRKLIKIRHLASGGKSRCLREPVQENFGASSTASNP
jgi:hypothetical protein